MVSATDVACGVICSSEGNSSRVRCSCRTGLSGDTNLPAIYPATAYPMYRDGNIAGMQHGAGGERALRTLLRRAGLGSEEISQEHP